MILKVFSSNPPEFSWLYKSGSPTQPNYNLVYNSIFRADKNLVLECALLRELPGAVFISAVRQSELKEVVTCLMTKIQEQI